MEVSRVENGYSLYHLGAAIVWHPSGKAFVASSIEGEVVLFFLDGSPGNHISLEGGTGGDISHLAFSADGRFLAAGGGGGRLQLWEIDENWSVTALERFKFRIPWIDRLVWHPSRPLLAVATGKTIQLWHGETRSFRGFLNFEQSSVLDLAWDIRGDRLAASGNLAVKIWRTEAWEDAPTVLELGAASSAIGWSPDGRYFAIGLFDRTVMVVPCDPEVVSEMTTDDAWMMRGFPAKISSLAWSPSPINHPSQPTLAVVSGQGVVLWDWAEDEELGWTGQVAIEHSDRIDTIAWSEFGLAIDGPGLLALWRSEELVNLEVGLETIVWHPKLPILVGMRDHNLPSDFGDSEIEVWRLEL